SGPNAHLRQVFDLMLQQDWNPDQLPCALPGSGIALNPVTQKIASGLVSLSATVLDPNGIPQPGVQVIFAVTAGANGGWVGGPLTEGAGRGGFTYLPGGQGTDTIVSSFADAANQTHMSNTATVLVGAVAPPNTPPVARCKNVTITNSPGVCAAPALIDAGSSDPDAGDTITTTQSPAGPYNVGTTSVTLTVTDSKGPPSTCTP